MQLSIGIRAKLSEKSLTAWRGDVEEQGWRWRYTEVRWRIHTNNNGDDYKTRALTDAKLKDLMKRLEKVTTENNKLRRKVKAKRTKGCSSSSKEEDSSYEEDVSKKKKKGRNDHDKSSYNSMSFNYDNMPSTTAYTSILVGKAPYFDGICYNQCKHCIKNYLYSISPEVCQVVCDGVDFLDDDEQPTPDQLQKIHRNAQPISILTLSIDNEEFNRVDDLDVVKDVWTTLWMSHEWSKPVIKAKVEMLEGQLNRFIIYDDKMPHEIFNRLKKQVNKVRALGSKKWTDRILTKRLLMTYTPINYKKDKKYTKKKAYDQAHVGQEWNSSDESSESESNEVGTIAIKGKTSSSKSLFPKLSKYTCVMTKEGRKKVKCNTSSSPKYVTSDKDTLSSNNYDSSDDDKPIPSELMKNPNVMMKGLIRQVGARD
jgi:hypothetical protein